MTKKRGLGRGLEALLSQKSSNRLAQSEVPTEEIVTESAQSIDPDMAQTGEFIRYIDVLNLQPGQYQPRRDMDPESLSELAESIRSRGLIQPISVRALSSEKFEILAGERRWRASQLAGLQKVPCWVKDVTDEAALVIALIENIQREDLNPIEEAQALKRLQEEFELTHQQIAEAVGKARTSVTNLLRLIQSLHPDIQKMIERGDLEVGHGKLLLTFSAKEQLFLAKSFIEKALSVRQAEVMVRKHQDLGESTKSAVKSSNNPDVERLERDLSERIGASVKVDSLSKGRGRLVILYNNLDELDGILAHIH
jgi:ParB family chromosome partitioning protein